MPMWPAKATVASLTAPSSTIVVQPFLSSSTRAKRLPMSRFSRAASGVTPRRALIVEEAGVEEITAAGIGDEPAAGFGGGVAVQVDETGNDELARGVDPVVRGPRVGAADERYAVVLVDQAAATQESVSSVVVGDHVPAMDDRSHRNLSSIPASTAGSGVPRNNNSGQCITAVLIPLPSGERAG